MTAITKIKSNNREDPEKNSLFYYVPDELRLKIAQNLPVKDLLSLFLVSKRFKNLATDTSLWKPILRSWGFNAPDAHNPYKNWREIRSSLYNKKVQVNDFLINARFFWHNGEKILTATPLILSDEMFRIGVSDYDLKTFEHYAFLPSKIVECNKDFLFAVHSKEHPEVLQAGREKGVQVYELVSGKHITTLSSEIDPIHKISVSKKRIKIIGLEEKIINGKTQKKGSCHKWEILSENSTHRFLKQEPRNQKPAQKNKSSSSPKNYKIIKETKSIGDPLKIEEFSNQKSIQENLNDKLSVSLEKEYKNYRIVKVIRRPNEDLCIIALQLKKSPEKIKMITYTFCGTLLKEYQFRLEHIQKIHWLYSRQFIWMLSDLGIVQYVDLLGKSTKEAVKRVWGETLKEKTEKNLVYYAEELKIKDHYLLFAGRYIPFKKSYIKNPNQILKDVVRCHFFTQTINLLPQEK